MKLLRIDLPPRFQDYGLLVLRLGFGFALIYGHGYGKVIRSLGGDEIRFADPYGLGPAASLALAAFAEFFCALLLMAGLYTRAALVPLIVTMFTIIFVVNFDKGFDQLEKAILFGVAFIALFLIGPGKLSLDEVLQKKNR
jgi:putative oxidoreductase